MKAGDLIDGKYRIVRLMGEGGMGAVWEVRHEVMGQRFALKTLHPQYASDTSMVQRFIREARAASAIGSEHIVYITDAGQAADGSSFLVMEYLEGEDLGEVLKREGRLDQARAIELMLQVCDALQPAHERGIIHRDLKPANLFLVQREKYGEWVKVVDFGIAKVAAKVTGEQGSLTKTGAMMGTPFFMAPEQFQKAKHVVHRADIYSCGVILYQLLSGKVPYDADTFSELVFAVATEPPIPLSSAWPGVDPDLEAVVMRAISKEAGDRYQSMGRLAESLKPFSTVGIPVISSQSPLSTFVAEPHPEAVTPPSPAIPATEYVEPSSGTPYVARHESVDVSRAPKPVTVASPALPPTKNVEPSGSPRRVSHSAPTVMEKEPERSVLSRLETDARPVSSVIEEASEKRTGPRRSSGGSSWASKLSPVSRSEQRTRPHPSSGSRPAPVVIDANDRESDEEGKTRNVKRMRWALGAAVAVLLVLLAYWLWSSELWIMGLGW